MKDTIITYETSVLAKEKGFDWDCERTFCVRHNDPKNILTATDYEWDFSNMSAWINTHIQAPTQSLLQKWLRDVHDIYVYVPSPREGFFDCVVMKNNTNHYRRFDDFNTNETDFTDYESALESGLFESLKLLP